MNAQRRFALFLLPFAGLSVGLSGCTSMDERSTRVAPASEQYRSEADQLYINKVERIAQRRGIDVQWVNPPLTKRRVAQADN